MLDRALLSELQFVLIEPPDGGDTWPSGIWTRAEVLDALNAGVRALARDTHFAVARTELPIAPGTRVITLPADWLATAYLVWRSGGLTGAVVLTADDFNRADGGLGPNWTTPQGWSAPTIAGGLVTGAGVALGVGAIYTGIAWSADQFSECTALSGQVRLWVRYDSAFWAGHYYELWADTTSHDLWFQKKVGGTYTTFQHLTGAVQPGDVLRLEVAGTTVRARINGAIVATVDDVDPALVGGRPGIGTDGGGGTLDTWQGGTPAVVSLAAIVRSPLGPVDAFESDLALPGWESVPGDPLGYADLDQATLTLRLVPTPADIGTLEILYIQVPPAAAGTGTELPVPEEFISGVKYATLGTLLRKVGRLLDPERAAYCERRYELAHTAAAIILGGWS